ncbi:MAG: 6-phospho-3-hexuloisomerase [Candidatus Nezhaarchaeales archaeon]|nr:MAG: 6-phospho-3-hexuloisomerase [Candidatus Nezhaarchaeota archaeon WYZ-LMO7]TDA34618.1 MAG: 6-phospho-3-hexuloisomerase [Candidatus Nezhaarchaeota archaeon WYZ-LMO8]
MSSGSENLRGFYSAMGEILSFLEDLKDKLNKAEVDKMVGMLVEAWGWGKIVLIVGAGRSGLIGRAFAMRLMHLGFRTYVVGETITPAIGPNDILIAISGSGSTAIVVTAAEAARKVGAKVIAITSFRDSPLARLADHVVVVPGRTKTAVEQDYFSRQILGIHEPLAPLGTLFELGTAVFLDSVVAELMYRLGKSEVEMKYRHAIIE